MDKVQALKCAEARARQGPKGHALRDGIIIGQISGHTEETSSMLGGAGGCIPRNGLRVASHSRGLPFSVVAHRRSMCALEGRGVGDASMCRDILAPNVPTFKVIVLSQMRLMGEVSIATLTKMRADCKAVAKDTVGFHCGGVCQQWQNKMCPPPGAGGGGGGVHAGLQGQLLH